MTDLWPRIQALLGEVERPARYLNHEWGSVYKVGSTPHFCMIYPDTYELGQANQALRILVNAVNAHDNLLAERAFLPALTLCDKMRAEELPLFSLESCVPVREFQVVGITLPHELAATNVLEALDLAQIPLHAAKRSEADPVVIAGGPCAFNPEPYAPFIDAFSIGEGERAIPEMVQLVCDMRERRASRSEILRTLAVLSGCYVPSLYDWLDERTAQREGRWIRPFERGMPISFRKRLFEGFAQSSGWEPCIVPFTEVVHDRLNVEILRGCARGCRFCQAGMTYRPVRERSADNVVTSVIEGLAETGYDEVSLTSLSSTDHSQIAEILQRLNRECVGKGIRISLPSQRLDSFGVTMAGLVAGNKKGGLTFAPEAGSQRLRDVINKNVNEQDLFGAIEAAFAAGWRRCKLYFMIGLPTETDEDVVAIAHLAQRVYECAKLNLSPKQRGSMRISLSCALFVPKAQTPFQWDGQIKPEEALRRVNLVRRSLINKAIELHWHDPASSFVEAVMSRAGREAASWVETAWRRGARFDAWTEFFKEDAWRQAADEVGLDLDAIAQTTYPTSRVMPWSHISSGVSTHFLAHERRRANEALTTPDCTFESCSACGACPNLYAENCLAGERFGSNLHESSPTDMSLKVNREDCDHASFSPSFQKHSMGFGPPPIKRGDSQ